ncbi:phage major capsid protein [Sphingomonas sp. RT2P30]|uniref:phage major capsid protein n=1 Tax=Parasphingomonas halimpatiens TaxID=3096162 RepID=UPI002FC7E608
MPTLRELQEQRETLLAGARERLDQINNNTDESRTRELEQQHDAAMAELDTLDARIERDMRLSDAERRGEQFREQELRNRRPIAPVNGAPGGGSNGEITYRDAFHAYLRSEGNIAVLSEEERSILRRGFTDVSQESRAQVTGTNTAGGYAVPIELQAEIIKTMKMWGPMYDPGITREMNTTSGVALPFPTVDDTGNTAAGTTQGTTLPDDGSGDVTFGQRSLGAYAYATPWIRVSKEFADDAILNVESLLGDLLGERLGRTANSQLTVGSGASAPNGIVTAAGLGLTAASATAIAADELFALQHSVDPAYRQSPKAGWMLADLTLKSIRLLKDGQGRYLWQMGNIQAGTPNLLLDYAYHVNQAVPQIATGNRALLFGDLGKYIVRKVGSPLIGAIQDKDFWPGFGIAGWIRFDGNLMDVAAVKALKLA